MKPAILLALVFVTASNLYSQTITFKKSSLEVKEPKSGDIAEKSETFHFTIDASDTIENVIIKTIKDKSAHPKEKYVFPDTVIAILPKGKRDIPITISSHSQADTSTYIPLSIEFKNKDGETQLVKDTLRILSTSRISFANHHYTTWNDGKRGEVFIGTNFDFFGSNTLTDWYGGLRVFLPSITNLKFDKTTPSPKFGLYGGIYHSKSFSSFGNNTSVVDTVAIYTRPVAYIQQVVGGNLVTYTVRQTDSVRAKTKNEINNWGAYFAPTFHLSRYGEENFSTNIFVAFHMEVIRRNISTSYSYDTISIKLDTLANLRSFRLYPKELRAVYYDAYFGATVPIQFLWKDIMDLKIIPGIGIGSPGKYSDKKNNMFYMVQFDLLARLGGLSLNLGGEVRGWFPNESPIFAAYVGTSFSIQKLSDFITKQ